MFNSSATGGQGLLNERSAKEIDRINAEFYGRFPYPWRSMRIDHSLDYDFERVMVCQNIGDYRRAALPEQPRIWVAEHTSSRALLWSFTRS